MNGKDIKVIIKTAVSLFLICAIAAGILAYVNSITSPVIAENNEKAANEARMTVMPEAVDFEEITLEIEGKESTGYKALSDNGDTIGYVFTTSANSYGGALQVMTGFDSEGVITGISILSIDDTPGLGMNAKKESFYSQYAGKTAISGGEPQYLAVDKDGGDIQAITSATITSRAVTSAVNTASDLCAEAMKGEK